MKSWARMKWRQHPATPVRPASSTTRLGTGNVTRVGTKSAPFTPGADPSRDGSGWPSRRKGSISMKSVTLFNPITRPAITTTTAKKYIDLFSFSVELGREEKSIQSGNGLMTRSNFESIFCWWLFYFSFHRLELTRDEGEIGKMIGGNILWTCVALQRLAHERLAVYVVIGGNWGGTGNKFTWGSK